MVQRKGKGSRREAPERAGKLRERAEEVVKRLEKLYPDARLELEYNNAFELLVEAILAAQESDKKVNQLRERLFNKYKSPQDIVNVPLDELERDISSINFYRRKAQLLKKCCEALVKEFGGDIPRTVEELTRLPGVGRKTANMVVGGAFGLPAIIVDRHVLRVSQRIGFTQEKDPDKVEEELRHIVPQEKWTEFSFLLLNHGKNVCIAKNPKCEECPICELCDSCKVKL
ncbi:DNA-(apurinic or apyrimidinic site) lyase /endonuclease III [Hydrogenivirga caldilitoris]|uniref:Endonuclease III n=1 Tax=Hydrogenivirga caldilitoris TaxID=246264 RepID=A0A497XMU5_9AQUI|nr:endonuclease III [Hydrogenivirga caldilitoris]RLJ70266.1 DNA-(apurinic or apyrimidinic site) lyase /endonuclease III [Hydrogenivirga caldilitoris]